jgi:hypothetical protein
MAGDSLGYTSSIPAESLFVGRLDAAPERRSAVKPWRREVPAMRRIVRLRTDDGEKLAITLDNWACGVDRLYRRWVREPDGWHCLETQKRATPETILRHILRRRARAPRPA